MKKSRYLFVETTYIEIFIVARQTVILIAVLTIDHKLELRELFRHREDLLLVYLIVAGE